MRKRENKEKLMNYFYALSDEDFEAFIMRLIEKYKNGELNKYDSPEIRKYMNQLMELYSN